MRYRPKDAAKLLIRTLGKREMEVAAIEIIKIAQQKDTWLIDVTAEDLPKDNMVLDGFQLLVDYRWLTPADKGYTPTAQFIARVCGKEAHEQDRLNAALLNQL